MSVQIAPIQTPGRRQGRAAHIPALVHVAAYEVYCHLYGEQQDQITGDCRGGFSVLEVIAFLYARSFPKTEWQRRVDEALEGADL